MGRAYAASLAASTYGDNMADGIKGFPRLIRATRVSYWGLASAWRTEEAFRTEACLCVLLIPAALWFGPSGIGRAVMLMSLFAVLITELLKDRKSTRLNSSH